MSLDGREDVARLRRALERGGIALTCCETAEQALDHMDRRLEDTTVGIGGSMTVRELGLYPRLAAHNQVFWHWEGATYQQAAGAESYITSVNALAATGEIVNIDGTGNRVSAMLFGHRRVFFLAGINKLTPDLESAIWRARNVAAPKNARRLGRQTPCAARADRCYNCASPQRICRGMTLIWEKMGSADEMEVVLINQDLGF